MVGINGTDRPELDLIYAFIDSHDHVCFLVLSNSYGYVLDTRVT